MVISGTTLALLALLATAGATGATAASNAIKRDRESLSDSELEDVLTYMSENSQPQSYSEMNAWDRYRASRSRANVSEDVRSKQDSVRENGFEDILNHPYWQSLSKAEQKSILSKYLIGEYTGSLENIDFDSLRHDLGEYDNIETAPILEDYVDVDKALADAQSAIDAENEMLLASLDDDLRSTGDAYRTSRDALLAQQHQNASQTMDVLASDMSRARRNAIEAGASAGVRIAENVNTLLSAQNQISNQSLETSNQLAQMLVSQRNAEAGLRNQWRDAQMSTYDRVQNRAQNEMNLGQQRYNQAQEGWQRRNDANVSESNALQDSMLKHKQRSAYSNRGSGSAY
jgi:hypothetical protein